MKMNESLTESHYWQRFIFWGEQSL